MPELTDHELLAEFARSQSEEAFATLAARYVNLVYSTALRYTNNSHHAEEVAQAVFIILARKAASLSSRIVLSGWLYQAARLTAANFVKGEMRRQRREQEAYMQSTLDEPGGAAWEQIAPLLDDAMGRLSETDRNAMVLRFFENKSAAEVAAALKLSEFATHKRTSRALEKLRKFFLKRGVSSTTAIISGAISVHSVQIAPAALAKSVSVLAAAKGAAATASITTLAEGTMKMMTWMKLKFATMVGASAVAVITISTMVLAQTKNPGANPSLHATASDSPAAPARAGSQAPGVSILDISKFYQVMPTNVMPAGILDSFFGRHEYDGLPFEIDGQAPIRGRKISGEKEFDGIVVGRTFDELDLIHHARWGEVEGRQIASVRLNYTDGTKHEFPISYGVHIRDWYRMQGEEKEAITDSESKIIWRRPPVQYDASIRLYKTRLVNPHPEKSVETIDFVSSDSLCGYYLLAATVANTDPARPVTPPVPSNEPERQFDGQITIRVMDKETKKAIPGALINPVMRIGRFTSIAPSIATSDAGETVLRYPTRTTRRIKLITEVPGYSREDISWTNKFPKDYTFHLSHGPE